MATLQGILDTAGVKGEIAKDMARDMAKKVIMPWSEELHKNLIKLGGREYYSDLNRLGYATYSSMDYENMEQMPEQRNFTFHQSPVDFGRYFSDDLSRTLEIALPGQPNGNLTSIVFGKRPEWTEKEENKLIDDSVYLCIGSGDKRPAKLHSLKGNEEITTPILYALIKDHVQILLPKNLTYQ